jgi:signal transduction histidine kinase/Flp pilus assembly protein TadD
MIGLLRFILSLWFGCFCYQGIAQKQTFIDSLETVVAKMENDSNKVQVLNKLCWENRLVNFAKAIDYGNKALYLGRNLNYERGVIKSLSFLGVTYINEGNHPLALQHFLEALDLAEKANDLVEVAYTYNNLGKLYYNEKNPQLYTQYFAKALEVARKTTNQDALAYSLRNVAHGYEYEGNYEKALEYHLEALKIRETLQRGTYLIAALSLTGGCYAELGQFDKAFALFNRALQLSTQSSTILDRADVLNAKARAFRKMQKYDSALIYAQEGYKIATQQNAWEWIKISSDILYNIYHDKKDFSKALQYHVIRSTYEDSIMNEGKMVKIKQLNLKHEFEQKERERAIAEEKKDILQQEEVKRYQLFAVFIVVALLALVVIVYLIYQSKVAQEKANILLMEKNEEIESQRNSLALQTDELAKQAEQLKDLNAVKNKLFSIISHDLRSPFAALSGALPLLESGDFTPEETSLILSDIKRMTDNASDMLENMLLWAKSQMNAVKATPTSLDLYEIAKAKAILYGDIAKQKDIQIDNKIASNTLVWADKNHVLLVFRNLIGNAIKFTGEGGKIMLSAENQGDEIIISVIDTGIGMPEDVRNSIFGEAIGTITTRGTAGEKGTGLGLLLCKEFVEKNNGKIWVESTLGEGTTFKFSLPKTTEVVVKKKEIKIF